MIGEWDGYYPNSFDNIFTISQLTNFIEAAVAPPRNVELVKANKIEYFNIPCAFDIEASSWMTGTYEEDNVQHFATMYIWQFGLNGAVIYGRQWEEFGILINKLEEVLKLNDKRHLIIYVHNLGYEFQWLQHYFDWDKVFAIKNRRPVYAVSGGIEFRCSYFLSNYALAYIGKELLKTYPVKKLTGDLDYRKIRHSSTPLSKQELAYCINDVKVVMSYIQEKIETDGDITKIPLTNTGYVRNYCRNACFTEGVSQLTAPDEYRKIRLNYHSIMKSLQVSSEEEYLQMRRAFMGGFTHASILYSNQVMEDVGSADLTSSYPYTMVAQYFPMTPFNYIGEVNDPSILRKLLSRFCCLFDVQFTNLRPRVEFENILSLSRCWNPLNVREEPVNCSVNNGRVISADLIATTLTELDFDNMTRFYSWDSMRVVNMRTSHRGYLPKALIVAVLDLYEAKTSLKGVLGKEIEYLVSKGMINAAFGMMVTNIVRGEYAYDNDDGWLLFEADVEKQISSYNKNFNRFLYYGWGVWVTAHARHNLFSAIYEFGADYVYSDTDSIKGINFQDHIEYFKRYNNQVFDNLINMCASLNIPFSKTCPKTLKGVEKMIGVWDIEEGYLRFKAAGAKRYIYELPNHQLQMTCAGVRKSEAIPYLLEQYCGGKEPWNEIWASDYLDNEGIPRDNYYSAFCQLARIAYSDSPAAKKALTFMLTNLHLDYSGAFQIFGEGMVIPAGHTGKQTLDYIDHGFRAICIDYLGITNIITEQSAVYMEPQSYCMSLTNEYRELLAGVEHVYD